MKQAFIHYAYVIESCIALISFFLVFVGVFLWVSRKGAKEIYSQISQIPLREENEGNSNE